MKLFDLHCDTITKLFSLKQGLYDGETQVNIKKTKSLEEWRQIFAIFIPDTVRGTDALEYFLTVSNYYKRQIFANYDKFGVKSNHLLSVEGGAVLVGNLENVAILRENNVKLLTLTWNGENELGFGADCNRGLKRKGFECVEKLEDSDIVIDVSHLSDAGFYDVASIANKPFVATHSNSRKIRDHRRNLTDEQFEHICSIGGVVGINFHKPFVAKDGKYFAELLNHIEHFLSLGGENVICIGSDFDGADMHESLDSIEKISTLVDALISANYSEELINKIMFKNACEFFERL